MPEPLVTVPEALGSGPSHSRAAESLEKNASRSWEDLLRTVRLLWKELLLCTFSAKTPRAAKLSPANPEPGAHGGGSSWMGQGWRQRGPGEALRSIRPPPCSPCPSTGRGKGTERPGGPVLTLPLAGCDPGQVPALSRLPHLQG